MKAGPPPASTYTRELLDGLVTVTTPLTETRVAADALVPPMGQMPQQAPGGRRSIHSTPANWGFDWGTSLTDASRRMPNRFESWAPTNPWTVNPGETLPLK